MKADDRKQAIMDMLTAAGSATVDDLSDRFGVSRMTVHRDLDDLEDAGLLRKIRGGATIDASQQFMADFTVRSREAVEEKRRIARAAPPPARRCRRCVHRGAHGSGADD